MFVCCNTLVRTNLLTTRVIHELDLDGLRADDGKARFELREHAQRFCELFVDLWDARTERVLAPAVLPLGNLYKSVGFVLRAKRRRAAHLDRCERITDDTF